MPSGNTVRCSLPSPILQMWTLRFTKIKASAQGKEMAERGSKHRWVGGQRFTKMQSGQAEA